MYEYTATYVETIDGDTFDCIVDLGFKVSIGIRIRLSIVDTPERGEPLWAEATQYTKTWLEQHPRFLLRTEKDKSGGFDRYLGNCYSLDETSNLNKLLLDTGLAVVYHRK